MATPITWKTIAAPDMGSELRAVQASGDALGDAIAGFGTSVQDVAGIAQKSETDEFIAALNAANTDDERTAMVEAADKAWLNMERVNTAVTDAELQDFKVAGEERAKTLSADQHAQAERQLKHDLLMDPLKVSAKELDIDVAQQTLDTAREIDPYKIREQKIKTDELEKMSPLNIEAKEKEIERTDLQLDQIQNNINIAENNSQQSVQRFQHEQELWAVNDANARQVLENSRLAHKEALRTYNLALKNEPLKAKKLKNELKRSAATLQIAEIKLQESQRVLKNHSIVSKQLNVLSTQPDNTSKEKYLRDTIQTNKRNRVDNTLLTAEYSRMVNEDRDVTVYGDAALTKMYEDAGVLNPDGTFKKGGLSLKAQSRFKNKIRAQVKKLWPNATSDEQNGHVNRIWSESEYREQFAQEAIREARTPQAKLAERHTQQVSELIRDIENAKSPRDKQDILDAGIQTLKGQDKPVPEKEMMRLGLYQKRVLETLWPQGVMEEFATMLGYEGDTTKIGAKDYTANNKLKFQNYLDDILRKQFKYVDEKSRDSMRLNRMNVTPTMTYFFDLAAEGTKRAKLMKDQVFEGEYEVEKENTQKVKEQGRNRYQNTMDRILGRIGGDKRTNFGINLTDPQKLGQSVADTYRKVDSMFGGKLDAEGNRVLKIAMHELMTTTEVEWAMGSEGEVGVSNIYYWPEVTDGDETDISKYKGYQIIEGILQHIPEKPTSKLSKEAIATFRKDLNKILKKDNKKISEDGTKVVDFDTVLTTKAEETVKEKDKPGKTNDAGMDFLDSMFGGSKKSGSTTKTAPGSYPRRGDYPKGKEGTAAFKEAIKQFGLKNF
tara:strand:- start:2919 stop:5420 length:2502 start_codon:yes stop_codon:yes gene_type:complete